MVWLGHFNVAVLVCYECNQRPSEQARMRNVAQTACLESQDSSDCEVWNSGSAGRRILILCEKFWMLELQCDLCNRNDLNWKE